MLVYYLICFTHIRALRDFRQTGTCLFLCVSQSIIKDWKIQFVIANFMTKASRPSFCQCISISFFAIVISYFFSCVLRVCCQLPWNSCWSCSRMSVSFRHYVHISAWSLLNTAAISTWPARIAWSGWQRTRSHWPGHGAPTSQISST